MSAQRSVQAAESARPDPRAGESAVPADVMKIERALARFSHLLNRSRRHGTVAAEAGIPVDRAAVPVLRLLSDTEPLRLGEVAGRLGVEPSHVTRQVQRLAKAGYVERLPDPDDHRAFRVGLTARGRDAADRIRRVGRQWMSDALAGWPPPQREMLAVLFNRMVDDFLAYSEHRQMPCCECPR
ncbi:MarR family transcriptional regulator [Actinomadura sp. NBRC 104425]|uniref:MarR family winged helix-turn-helix transcriptional regulator n=1 Tax=Actinomadura sp. NBRC 104425 TaxID=3032204 RepID=UPI0024A5345E|nr:MarR family transcriptional regulator [Actinomadura sp. NBRC 104425]GLZ11421.1 MarR family transcriptional regulator [Actinomadura sp. NBRC 104425]